mmetsp:Transcript_13363/g.29081  ORF Transcript_13363/g.29081 Transcript_13363/m.29081 type:complete len:83 (+) Transcript_13363:477-725(+)
MVGSRFFSHQPRLHSLHIISIRCSSRLLARNELKGVAISRKQTTRRYSVCTESMNVFNRGYANKQYTMTMKRVELDLKGRVL